MEREALLDFKAGVGDTRNRLSSWTGHHCCTWKGVACDTTTGHVHLDLSFNNFSGIRIPEFIGSFKKLRYLNLSSTQFMGGIPARVGNLSSLYVLNMSYGGLNSIPVSVVHQMTNLIILDLRSNLFNCSMPSSVGKLSNLTELYLGGNSLRGIISEVHFENLTRLQVLDLYGTMPAWFWNISSSTITYLDLSNNQIGGKLPSSLKFTKLVILFLYSNRFEGQLPIWPHVRFVSISDNMLDGGLSSSICQWTYLEYLDLSNNKLLGEIPYCLGDELLLLQLQNNSFSGEVPLSLKNCTNLWLLRLRSNMFSGVIPWQLARFERLQILDLANNNFSGSIPHNIDLHYLKCSMKLMKSLDLSNNSLIGEIPKGIGDLAGLKNLNLSRNYLQGKIPWEIGGMKSLESLDLSINDLYGSIPESLSALYFLSYLNLSYNNLSGMIPSGRQLQTLNDPSIYMGNADLCGPPTSKSCFDNKTTQIDIQEHEKEISDWLWFYISMVLGFVMGFWIFCDVNPKISSVDDPRLSDQFLCNVVVYSLLLLFDVCIIITSCKNRFFSLTQFTWCMLFQYRKLRLCHAHASGLLSPHIIC
uniref:Leucine-rich repeat-containing N-terminal plant-type domain-containing protein n=1 Tax=Musa acuminata subsp. malaccensis TaxID=214687 RepID=A0A804KR23_MUSAM